MSTAIADIQMTGIPGAGAPPPGYCEVKVPPRYLTPGDKVLLGGQVRIVQCIGYGTLTGRLVVILESAETAETNTWHPLTGDLPIPVWRAGAPVATSAQEHLQLLKRVLNGLRAIPVDRQPDPTNAAPSSPTSNGQALVQAGGPTESGVVTRSHRAPPRRDTLPPDIVAKGTRTNRHDELPIRHRTAYWQAAHTVERF